MGFKCAPQVLGLVRGEPKKGSKHRANGKAILAEMGEHRYTSSDTFDASRSHLNKYNGLSANGFECWDYIEDRADNYKIKGKAKNGKEFEHGLRKDAVVGFAVIINPPEEECVNWSNEQYNKFYNDTWDFLEQKEPRVFRRGNLVMDAEHYDEGHDKNGRSRHLHRAGEARDKDGKYCGNLIDAKLLSEINKEYPKFMRERGWEMDDLDTTNWDKYKSDSDYRAERKVKAKNAGNSVNKYLKKKSAKEAQEEADGLQTMIDFATKSIKEREKLNEEKKYLKDYKEYLKEDARAEADYQMTVNEAQMQIIRGQFETVMEQKETDFMLKNEKLVKDQKKLMQNAIKVKNDKADIELKKKEQEQKDAKFQEREDALEAQRLVLDTRDKNAKAREDAVFLRECRVKAREDKEWC